MPTTTVTSATTASSNTTSTSQSTSYTNYTSTRSTSTISNTTSYSTTTTSVRASNSTTTTTTNQTTSVSTTNATSIYQNQTTSTTATFNNTSTSSTLANSTGSSTTTIIIANSTSTTSQTVATKWDPYNDFYSFLNYGVFNDGGDCYGFSSTAILYFTHYTLGDQTYPYYPVASGSVASMPGGTGKYCLLQYCFASSDTLSQTTFPIYIHEAYAQAQLPFNWNDPSNEQAQAQLLMQSIQNGSPVVLALGPTDGHAVVAYSYTKQGNGSLTIGISDPNYGNEPRTAYYENGQFSYSGTTTWSTFTVVSPEMLQWSWLSPSQLSGTVSETNSYYTYVFSSVPITIVGQLGGQASFTAPGDSLTFQSNISGVVGFEEGNIQAYAIPNDILYSIKDPGATSSMVTVIIPQNKTSIVGYQLTSSSSTPLNMTVIPTSGRLNVSTSTDVNLSVSLFSVGEHTDSVLNATSIPVASSQSAIISVPNWGNLNSTQSAANLQVFGSDGTSLISSRTLVNQQTTSNSGAQTSSLYSPLAIVAIVAVVAIVGVSTLFIMRKRRPKHHG